MYPRPPRPKRTDTLFPYTTRFRSDSRLRPDQLHRIASDRVAAARELHAGRQYLAKAVVDDHGAGCGGEYSETGILIGCVQRASAIGPVVVPRSTLPEAVAAVDGVVELGTGRAIPEIEEQPIGVDQIDLAGDGCLDKRAAAAAGQRA